MNLTQQDYKNFERMDRIMKLIEEKKKKKENK